MWEGKENEYYKLYINNGSSTSNSYYNHIWYFRQKEGIWYFSLAVGALRSSGLLEVITQILAPITNKIGFPSQVIPLALLRPISGSASLGVATDIMTTYGVDSKIGLITSTIMGSTETTFYTIAVYTSSIGVKKIRFVLAAALIADFVGMITSAILWNLIG